MKIVLVKTSIFPVLRHCCSGSAGYRPDGSLEEMDLEDVHTQMEALTRAAGEWASHDLGQES